MHDNLNRIADVIKIVQRLTHAHKHDIGQHAAISGVMSNVIIFVFVRRCRGHIAFRPFAERVAGKHDLPYDFPGRQVAYQPHCTRVAETTVQRAAHLARNT